MQLVQNVQTTPFVAVNFNLRKKSLNTTFFPERLLNFDPNYQLLFLAKGISFKGAQCSKNYMLIRNSVVGEKSLKN